MTTPKITPEWLKKQPPAIINAVAKDVFRIKAERSLIEFLRQAWEVIDPSEFVGGWHLDAMAEHLEAVSRGQIRRLLINVPPRHCKSLLVSVAWPAWIWAKDRPGDVLSGPKTKFLCLSYAQSLALDHARLMRKLVTSPWYQSNWGTVKLSGDQEAKENFDNVFGGTRLSGGIDGTITGRGGDIKILDDPHKVKEVESDIVREGVIKTYDETLRNRVTSPKTSAEVIVMQRIAENDLSGHVLDTNTGDVVHLMLPAEFEPARKCYTMLGWEDPRTYDGEILWKEQWGQKELAPFKQNEFQWAGQYQQSPSPRGGGIIKRDWWKLWPPDDESEVWQTAVEVENSTGQVETIYRNTFPDFEYIIASCDTAYTEKQENDFSACVVLGVFRDHKKHPKTMLITAWQDRLELHALVNKILRTCSKRGCDAVVVEAKASGKSVAQEIRRLMIPGAFTVVEHDPKNADKVARMYAVQPLFAAGTVFAPDTNFAEMVIAQAAIFPKGAHDDLCDALAQGLQFLRKRNLAQLPNESEEDDVRSRTFRPKTEAVRDGYGV